MVKAVIGLLIYLLSLTCLLLNTTLASELSIPLPRTITQDSDGFVWVGTQTDVKRYDGHHFTSLAQHYGYINKIVSNNKTTLVAASNAIVSINKQLQETLLFTASQNNRVLDLVQLNNNLYVLLQQKIIRINLLQPTNHKVLFTFKSIKSGALIAFNNEVCYIHIKSFSCHNEKIQKTFQLELPESSRGLLIDKRYSNDDAKFIIATKHSLYQYSATSHLLTLIKHFKEFEVNKIAYVANNNNQLWLVINNEIKRLNLSTKRFVEHHFKRELTSKIYNIYQSSDNTLWLAATKLEKHVQTNAVIKNIANVTQTSGMAWFINYFSKYLIIDTNGIQQLNIETLKASSLDHINKITQGNLYSALLQGGDLFVGGYYGLFKVEPINDTVVNLSALVNNDTVQCLRKINSFLLAVCTANNGVYLYDLKNNTATLHFKNKNITSIVDFITVDGDINNTWIATDSGLYHLENKHLDHYLSKSHVIRLAQQNNTLFAATINSGLYKINRFDQAVKINKINVNGIGERINDIALNGEQLSFSTALGMGIYNTKTEHITTYPLGYSVGRIHATDKKQEAISGNGKLVNWTNESPTQTQSQLYLSNFLVNGKNALLSTALASNDFVELIFSTNAFSETEQTFRTKINDHPWNNFSTINQLSFLPKWGNNIISIQAKTGQDTLTKTIHFYVNYPFYVSSIAKLFYALLLIYLCYALLHWFANNKRLFIKQKNDNFEAIKKIKTESNQQFSTFKQHLNSKLLSKTHNMYKSQAAIMAKVIEANIRTSTIDYTPVFESLHKVSALMLIGQYDKAIDDLEEISTNLQITASLAAPDVITNTDIVTALQQLIMSKTSQKAFLYIDYTSTPILLPETEINRLVVRYVYKCIYELLTYIIEELSISSINLSLTHANNCLSLSIDIDDNRMSLASFNEQNLSLYQVGLLAYKLKAKLTVESLNANNVCISLSAPLDAKTQINLTKNNVNFKDEK